MGGSADIASTLEGSVRYLDRELSRLDFDRRVLALAEDRSLPLLERVKFLAIFSTNLDEFFQVRVALLHAEYESGVSARLTQRSPLEQLADIRDRVVFLTARAESLFRKELRPQLAECGIRICDWRDLDEADRAQLSRVFDESIFPILTPLAVDPAHPFPYVSNLSFNLGVLVRHPTNGVVRFARVKVPNILDRFQKLGDGRLVPSEQVIAAHLEQLFPEMSIESRSVFRVTRDAGLDIREDEAEDLLVAIESGLQRRRRLSDAVRLEVEDTMPVHMRELLLEELDLDLPDLYVRTGPLDLGDLWEIYDVDRPDLKDSRWAPRPIADFPKREEGKVDTGEIFEILRERDVLVHHPYDSFDNSVEIFLRDAARDPAVLAIKHTIYRTSGPENPIGRTLIEAAQSGKQVVTLVELKARFDEHANISWARKLEEAGIHVVYGLVGLKTHAKVVLVVRRERDGIRRYCHVGTGNYHPVTARLYEDVGIFSASPDLTADLGELFNNLTGFSHETTYRKLLVAPHGLRDALIGLIRAEAAASDGEIVIKVNNLSDPGIIDALYEASEAGVSIDLIVRSICCLRAGVPGLSENIRVRSILGRFLEHSRIFRFGSEARGRHYLVGSADLMPRNLNGRVETLMPVEEPALQERLEEILALELADDRSAWALHDSTWERVPNVNDLSAQEALQERARIRSESA